MGQPKNLFQGYYDTLKSSFEGVSARMSRFEQSAHLYTPIVVGIAAAIPFGRRPGRAFCVAAAVTSGIYWYQNPETVSSIIHPYAVPPDCLKKIVGKLYGNSNSW